MRREGAFFSGLRAVNRRPVAPGCDAPIVVIPEGAGFCQGVGDLGLCWLWASV